MIHHKTHWDLIIVGAGALGTFHALFALRKGLNVLLLEKDLRPVEATVRNFGQVIPSGMVEDEWFDYGKVSLETYLSIQAEFDISVRQNGSTYLASTEEELAILHEKADFYDLTGYSPIRFTAAECIRKLPAVKSDYCKGGLYFPQEISIEPQIMIHRLHEYLIAKYDLDYRPSTPVKECIINQNSCEVIDTMGNRYKAGRIMICNGRDFKFLLPELFLKSELELVKLQMLSTYPMPHVKLPGSILSGLSIRRYGAFKSCKTYTNLKPVENEAQLKKWGVHILFKQAIDGSIIIGDSHEYADVSTADTLDYTNDEVLNQLILTEARKILDLPSWKIQTTWNGYYCQSKNAEIFNQVIDSKINIVTGIGGKGMTTSCGYASGNIEKIFG